MSQLKSKNSSEKVRNSSSIDEKHKNDEQKTEKKGKMNVLHNSGILEAYEYVLKSLCKTGLPAGNLYEYAAQQVLNYEKKYKRKAAVKIATKPADDGEKHEKIAEKEKNPKEKPTKDKRKEKTLEKDDKKEEKAEKTAKKDEKASKKEEKPEKVEKKDEKPAKKDEKPEKTEKKPEDKKKVEEKAEKKEKKDEKKPADSKKK